MNEFSSFLFFKIKFILKLNLNEIFRNKIIKDRTPKLEYLIALNKCILTLTVNIFCIYLHLDYLFLKTKANIIDKWRTEKPWCQLNSIMMMQRSYFYLAFDRRTELYILCIFADESVLLFFINLWMCYKSAQTLLILVILLVLKESLFCLI